MLMIFGSFSDNIFCNPIDDVNVMANTVSLETDIQSTFIRQTIERIQQLNQSVVLESYPFNSDSPSVNFDFLLKDENLQTVVPRTSESFLKEQLLTTGNSNITFKFEEVFTLPSNEARLLLCKKISAHDSQMFANKMIEYLTEGEPEQAFILNQLLPELKEELEDSLINFLREKNQKITEKRAIIYALGRIKSEKSVPFLWNEIQTTDSEDMLYTCVQALANMPHSVPLEQWVQLLQSSSIPVSLVSARAISEYGGSSAEEQIRRALMGEIPVSQKVLEYLLDRISNYPLEIFIPFSIDVMNANSYLAQKIATILKQKTGKDFGPNAEMWAKWWKERTNNMPSAANPGSMPLPQNNPLTDPNVKIRQPKTRRH
ncbi:MAG TPA: HEAT repeat domain-containing protein [Candidatus Hydrogenedens sp.]|nr:HEAT repeat domain-containing protein [Candidatus Hydrogenedens sp.]